MEGFAGGYQSEILKMDATVVEDVVMLRKQGGQHQGLAEVRPDEGALGQIRAARLEDGEQARVLVADRLGLDQFAHVDGANDVVDLGLGQLRQRGEVSGAAHARETHVEDLVAQGADRDQVVHGVVAVIVVEMVHFLILGRAEVAEAAGVPIPL